MSLLNGVPYVPYVPSRLRCWRALVPSCPRAQIFGVPSCHRCWRALAPKFPACPRAFDVDVQDTLEGFEESEKFKTWINFCRDKHLRNLTTSTRDGI